MEMEQRKGYIFQIIESENEKAIGMYIIDFKFVIDEEGKYLEELTYMKGAIFAKIYSKSEYIMNKKAFENNGIKIEIIPVKLTISIDEER